MKYLDAFIFLASFCIALHFLLPGRSLRDWRHKAISLLGILGMVRVCMGLYANAHAQVRCANGFFLAKGLVTGTIIGIFISLCLAGWGWLVSTGARNAEKGDGGPPQTSS